jgi:hypothetical protein
LERDGSYPFSPFDLASPDESIHTELVLGFVVKSATTALVLMKRSTKSPSEIEYQLCHFSEDAAMKVDLEELRALVDRELQKVEQRRVLLQEQLEHIEAVQRLAERTQPEKPEESKDAPPKADEEKRGTTWFRRS